MRSDMDIIKITVLLVLVNVIIMPIFLYFFAFSIALSLAAKVVFFFVLSVILQLAVYFGTASFLRKQYAYTLLSMPLYAMPALIAVLIRGITAKEILILYAANLSIGQAVAIYRIFRHRER